MAGLEKSDLFNSTIFTNHGINPSRGDHDTSIGMNSTRFSDTVRLIQSPKRRRVKPQSDVDMDSISTISTTLSDTAKSGNGNEDDQMKWKKIIFEYSQNTTFHGPRLIFEPQPFLLRRVIWLCLFFGCTSIFLLQVSTNVQYYMSWPVSVDVKINYNDSITFPAFTLCNANSFRVTKASEYGYYTLLNSMFSPNGSTLAQYNTTGVYLNDLYNTAHDNSDFIVSCRWDEAPCSHTDFQATMTDFGKCYTFNSGVKDSLRLVRQTGAKGGLRLQLNIEQYEYMRGPNDGAGLKILLHHPLDIPLVRDYGASIPPGTHGLVALKILEIHNQKPNYGKCNDSVGLTYYDVYSMSNCYTDCQEKYLAKNCECRDVYMSQRNGAPDICSVNQYENCMKPSKDVFFRVRNQCECPIPCDRQLYEPTVSYATTSNFDIDALLKTRDTPHLRSKYSHAREVVERVDNDKVNKNKELITGFIAVVDTLNTAMRYIQSNITQAQQSLHRSYGELLQRVQFHNDNALLKVKSMLEFNFIRATVMYDERAFHYVTLDFYGLPSFVYRSLMEAINTMNVSDVDRRRLVYLPLKNLLEERQVLIRRANSYIYKLNRAYSIGSQLLTYQQSYRSRYDKSYISLPLLQSGAADQSTQYSGVRSALSKMNTAIDSLKGVGKQFIEKGIFNTSYYNTGKNNFNSGSRSFNAKLHWYEKLVVYKALDVINARISLFEVQNRTLHNDYISINWKVEQMKEIIDTVLVNDWQAVLNISKMSSSYLNNKTTLKTPLCKAVTSAHLEKAVSVLTFLFEDINLKIKDMKITLNEYKIAYINVWLMMLNEIYTQPFYAKLHKDVTNYLNQNTTNSEYENIFSRLLGKEVTEVSKLSPYEITSIMNADFPVLNTTVVLENIDKEFVHLRNTLEMAAHIGDSEEKFLSYFKLYKEEMALFLKDSNVDTTFFRENFMSLDVFVQELSYEEITQQKAYDVAKLLSDIGGLMGLFVGGSVVTIFELMDLILHNGIRKILLR